MSEEIRRQIVDALVDVFVAHGKPLSRRAYQRLNMVPLLGTIERQIGWGVARDLAEIRIHDGGLLGTWKPTRRKKASPILSEGEGRKATPPRDIPGDDSTHKGFTFLGVEPGEDPAAAEEDWIASTEGVVHVEKGFYVRNPGDEEVSIRRALMTGLKKTSLPIKYRRMISGLVWSLQDHLEALPAAELPPDDETADALVLGLGDLHSGKWVLDSTGKVLFNADILAFRMRLLKLKVERIIQERLKFGRLDEVVLAANGDLADGSGIYPGQELHQDLTPFSGQIALAAAAIWDIIKMIRGHGLRVRFYGIRGNHGRQYKYAPAENNFDYLVYQLLKLQAHYEDPQVLVEYGTVAEYHNFTVKGFRFHLRHMAPPQAETPAGKAKFGGWREIHDYSVMLYGHLHHPGHSSFLDAECFMCGALPGIDDLAERLAVFSRPSQLLLHVVPGEGIRASYNLYLDHFGHGGEAAKLMDRYPALRAPFEPVR